MDEEKGQEQEHFSNDPIVVDANEEIEENDLSESSEEVGFSEGQDRVPGPNTVNALTPKVGMTFKTVDEAYQFYSYYAYRIGFGIAKTCSRRKDGVQHEYTFSCEKSGRPKDKKGLAPKRTRISKKTGCQAKFRVRLNEDGLWHLAFLVLHHNHYCSPNESHRYRSHKMTPFHAMPYDAQRLSEGNYAPEATDLSTARLDSSPGDGRAVDSANGAGQFRLGEGDAEAIAEYLARMQSESPLFFHLMDLDGEGRLKNIFWADTRSRMSYPYFNDVVLLDTSCLSNKNGGVPFASFTGVSHHGSVVFFGGALLCNERPETYAWLFRAWLASMGGLPPRAIITDKSKSIDSAVLEVFPNALHRLCIWQIMKRVPEALAGRSNQKAAKERLHDVVFDSLKPDEFEQNWVAMVNEYKLGDSEWLLSLYEERRRWVPAFVKDTFWAGMSGIQRSDVRAPYFDRFVTSKNSLKQFLPAYEAALQARYNREFQEEHGGEFHAPLPPPPPLISRLSMEEDFSMAYTLNMFQRFQQELQKCVDCTCVLIRKDGAISTYQVKERVKQRTYSYEVLFNEDQVEVQCLCRGFEFGGVLCSHAIVVLKEKDVQRAPPRYICRRWRKSFKEESRPCCPLTPPSDVLGHQSGRRFERLLAQCLPHLSRLAEIGASFDHRPEQLLRLLAKVEKKLADARRAQKGKGQEGARHGGSSCRSTADGSATLQGNGLVSLSGSSQLVNEAAGSQGLVPYYLVPLGEQPASAATAAAAAATSIPPSISSSPNVGDFWGQKDTSFPNIPQLRNQ